MGVNRFNINECLIFKTDFETHGAAQGDQLECDNLSSLGVCPVKATVRTPGEVTLINADGCAVAQSTKVKDL